MLLHRRRGAVGITTGDQVQDAGVVSRHRGQPAGQSQLRLAKRRRAHAVGVGDFLQRAVVRAGDDRGMKLAIGRGERFAVPPAHGGHLGDLDLLQPPALDRRHAHCGEPRARGFEDGHHFEKFDQLVDIHAGHDGSTIGRDLDQPGRVQLAQRFTNRRSRDPELLGQAALVESTPGGQRSTKNPLTDLPPQSVRKRVA